MANNDLVRPSRDGDQFHYHWAARQCLALLPGSSDLKAVTVEGPSSNEGEDEIEEGIDLIDVGLYYGSETLVGARCVRYIQLKHSTRQVSEPWQAGGLSKTLRGFTKRYKKLLEQFSVAELKRKVRFEFTTNRPIDPRLKEALQDLTNATQARHPVIEKTLLNYSELSKAQNTDFFSLFSFDGDEPSLWAQRNLLSQDVANYLADTDYDAPIQLKELVTRKAGSEFKNDPSIRRHDVLRALKVSELELSPAPCQIVCLQDVFAREQESDILEIILKSEHPVIVHADGGIGKSILAQRLAASMPTGSESVLYDCFGDGLYRNALHYRHRHRDALVQIANELASRGLCHPLLPSSHADSKQYMQAFCSRLTQAIGILRAENAGATLCLIIDAADNADMAAEELNEHAFVKDLIRALMPNGVRLVFTCRTHRRQRLNAPLDSTQVELRPFNEAETAQHLRAHYPQTTQAEIAEFAYLSSSNPRVQALALERRLPIMEMLKQLGPEPTSVERAIGDLLQRAVDRLKDQAGVESNQIDLICQGLAVLRPLVPVTVLARISGTSESAVRSFALDLGRPLFVKGESLHFLDEPAETWFHETFKPDADGLNQFLNRLRPLAGGSSYVASTLPQILLAAGRLDELIDLALSEEGLPEAKPLERRDVELQRLMFALKACLQQGRHLPAAKLALKAAGENAGEARHTKLIQENTDIAACLLAVDRVNELVSRRTFYSTWMGSHHAYDACLLSGVQEFTPEAASRLRMAMDWLHAWARNIPTDGPRESVTNADRAEIALATLRLHGPEAAARFLRRWKYRHLALMSGKRIAQRLIDLGKYAELDALAYAAGNDVWLLLGLAREIAQVGGNLPAKPLARLIRLLADRRVKLPESTGWDERWEVLYAVQSALSLAMRTLPIDSEKWVAIIQRYLPQSPPNLLSDSYGSERAPMMRAYALEAELCKRELSLIEMAPTDVHQQLVNTRSYGESRDTHVFKREVGGLLPWIVLSVKTSCGLCPSDLDAQIASAVKATDNAESRDYQRHYTIRQSAAIEWIRILRDSPAIRPQQISALQDWLDSREVPLWPDTLTTLCRLTARTTALAHLSFDFAFAAFEALEQLRDDAETRTDAYVQLARAILPTSAPEANAYFSRAVEVASRIGDENLSRWSAMLDLAKAASSIESRAETAYRLSRAAELTYEYVARDKYFDWDRTVEALVDLCPPSALAILSRWRDRRFGDEARLLPEAIRHLVSRSYLPTISPVALAGIDAHWSRLKNLQDLLEDSKSSFDARTASQIAYRYLRVQSHNPNTWQSLIEIGRTLALELPDVHRLLKDSQAAQESSDTKRSTRIRKSEDPLDKKTPDWLHFFDGLDMADSSALRAAYADLKTYDPPYQFEDFFREAIRLVGLTGAGAFIKAVTAWVEFGAFELRYLLDAITDSSLRMISLRSAVREAVRCVCKREPERTGRHGWRSYLPFERLVMLGVISDRDIAVSALAGFAEHADKLEAGELFQLIEPLSSFLNAIEADEALNYGLNLLEDVLHPEDGDGPWSDKVRPPVNCVDALAGYIWAGLGSPVVSTRWEFAHVVRACSELSWLELLAALERCALARTATSFFDQSLQFYEWHARQWMLIGLVRGGRETPQSLLLLHPFLRNCLKEEHVILRAFAAEGLRYLHDKRLLTAADQNLDTINAPHFQPKIYSGWDELDADDDHLSNTDVGADERYYFGVDIGPYWLAPLGRAFGVSEKGMEIRAGKVIQGWLGGALGWSREDTRYTRKIFTEGETSHTHGSMPRTDDLRAYHAYHAMMIIASNLLETRTVRQASDETNNEFEQWMEDQLLTRSDGGWLADRRDPPLVSHHLPKESSCDDDWCWRVTAEYLDRQLLTDDGMHVFWGHWSTGEQQNRETVSVRSSLVSRNGAQALVAALQTAPQLDGFTLPSADHHESLKIGDFSLKGWVSHRGDSLGLDEYDPWAAEIGYPAISPGSAAIDDLGLRTSADGRWWLSEFGGKMRSESWAQTLGYGRETELMKGTRLSGDSACFQSLLQRYPLHCLIISVSVKRIPPRNRKKGDEFEPYPAPYVRYYLMDHDAISHPL
ncbi:NACHT domain-containing protein [Pseudomonas shirazensis]|uniref:NACHT domain-containing protein n=1 Tax=Pseudomonas shirazensis TaxID=2745494 RepID=UPI003985A9E5